MKRRKNEPLIHRKTFLGVSAWICFTARLGPINCPFPCRIRRGWNHTDDKLMTKIQKSRPLLWIVHPFYKQLVGKRSCVCAGARQPNVFQAVAFQDVFQFVGQERIGRAPRRVALFIGGDFLFPVHKSLVPKLHNGVFAETKVLYGFFFVGDAPGYQGVAAGFIQNKLIFLDWPNRADILNGWTRLSSFVCGICVSIRRSPFPDGDRYRKSGRQRRGSCQRSERQNRSRLLFLILLSYHEALGVSIERKTISKNYRRAGLVFRTSSGAAEREANFRRQGRASALEAVAKSGAVSRL